MKRYKILFILQLPPPVHGASLVNKSILDSERINSSFECHYINLTTAKDVNDIGKNGLKKYFRSLLIYFGAFKKTFANKYDAVYLTLTPHGLAFYKDALLALMLKPFTKKMIFHLHGKGINKMLEKSKLNLWLYKFVFKNVHVIHLSKLLYSDIKEICSEEFIKFLPNGTSFNRDFDFRERNKTNNILYLSNMQESKGSFILLQAAKILKDKNIDFSVDFIGKWHNDISFKEKWLKFYDENELESNVTYHGPKYNGDKHTFLEKSSVFVLPTSNDCYPLAILEAMSYGLPVVSTDEGAVSEIVEDGLCGFIINKKDPKDLADKIIKILENDNLRMKLGNNAKEKFETCYTLDKFEKNFCEIIKEILVKNK